MASSYSKNYSRTFGKKKSKRKSSRAGCGCPSTAVRVSTKGRGRGFVCMAKKNKVTKRHGLTYVTHPFVKAVGCR
jgi:hypothetical protein